MIRALRNYIMEQNKTTLETKMADLKKSLDFDSTAIDHLHLALYSFQVSKMLLNVCKRDTNYIYLFAGCSCYSITLT